MVANRFSGQARRAARCPASGKRRNEPGEPICPTAGRVLFNRGIVALLCRCTTSPWVARLATAKNHPGQMVPFGRIVLWTA